LRAWFSRQRNIGVALGPRSGIVDFETDDEAGERWLIELFNGNLPTVPTFQSRKGKHRLFQFRADLPHNGHKGINQGTGKNRVRIADLKLGNGRHRETGKPLGTQSVFPPSVHYTGARYTWTITPNEAEPAKLPDIV
jgi:Bifunctional DNA primase/polymerase, N-terminal